MKVAIVGALGRMGRAVIEEMRQDGSFEISGLIEARPPSTDAHLDELMGSGYPHVPVSDGWTPQCAGTQIIIDFSSPAGTGKALDLAGEHGIALVCGTTGLPDALKERLASLSRRVPVFYSPNMSAGMHLMKQGLRAVVRLLPAEWDVEIIEVHHKMKKDAPSGTALELERLVARERRAARGEARGPHQIHSLRVGQVPGIHRAVFAGAGEILEVVHSVHSRAPFARGALAAARFLMGRSAGWYGMEDLYGPPPYPSPEGEGINDPSP
jgi:4-hydroxy-tetrahydrodipicolinate reductase